MFHSSFLHNHHHAGLTTEIQHSLIPKSDVDTSWKLTKSCHPSIKVVQPDRLVDCISQAEWGNIWWETIQTTPKNKNPLTSDKSFGKIGSVQMLAGTGGGDPVVRSIQVDDKTYLFAPIITQEVDNAGFPPDWTTADSAYFTKSIIDAVKYNRDLFYEVDGKSLINGKAWNQYRQESPNAFSFVVPDDHYIGPDGGYTTSLQVDNGISDGYWVMLNPLPVGNHTIHFGGSFDLSKIKVEDLDGDGQIGFDPKTTPSPTAKQVIESLLQGYQSSGVTIKIDVTYNVGVTHSTETLAHLDLSALATS